MVQEKFDLYRIYKDEYIAPDVPRLVRNLSARYLTVTGKGSRALYVASRKGFVEASKVNIYGE